MPPALEHHVRRFFSEGNPLNKLGALSLIAGAVIVFKYAVDNQWIGPSGRVALGFAVGGALFAGGEVYARRGWQLFASGLTGAGNGVLFAAVYFGQQQYGILPAPIAFSLYVLLTAAAVVQSLRYDALALAVWGLLGGYLTPVLASTGSGNYVFLSCYLLVLNTGVFAVAYRRNWPPLKWMAFLLTAPYTIAWVAEYVSHPHHTPWLELRWILPFLGIYFLYFAAIPTWRSLLAREPIDRFGQVLTVANGVLHFACATVLLYEDHRAWLGVVSVVAAVLYVFITSRMVREPRVDAAALRVFAGTAAGFLLLATPYLVSGPAITLVWCGETVFLAWACARPRFAFLRMHVLAMLGVIAVRLIGYDDLLSRAPIEAGRAYLPFAQPESFPPFAAAVSFGLAGHFLGRLRGLPGPPAWIVGLGLLVLAAAVDGEAARWVRFGLAPLATHGVHELAEAGILVATLCALWFGVVRRMMGDRMPAALAVGFAAVLLLWVLEALVWPGGYGNMRGILGAGYGLWWLHGGALLMLPLVWLLLALGRETREAVGWLSAERVQAGCLAAALVVTLLLLRREIFAVTHAPPLADWFDPAALIASYRMLLSLAYAFLAFGIYLTAVRSGNRPRLHAAYALYVFTAIKVYVFDLGSQQPLYRATSLLVFAAILFVSSYFANRQQRSHA